LAANVSQLGEVVFMNSNGTSVVLSTSAGTVHTGQAVTFSATVTASFHFGGALNGNVSFYNNGVLMGTTALSHGVAQFTTSSLSVGTHSITAIFEGNASYNRHGSGAISEVVQP
jgi:hypothetical protein